MLWTHPRKPWLSLRRKACAALAVIEMGIRDHAQIAAAVGLSLEEVAQIDAAEDAAIRELGLEGIPAGEFFALAKVIRCPRCGARLTLAPCVTCQSSCNAPAQAEAPDHHPRSDRRGILPQCGNMARADAQEINGE